MATEVSRETIQKILEVAVNAPSGSNSQPWRFRFYRSVLEVVALPEKDHPILNFLNRGTWVAHGALIENISIVAREFGYDAFVTLFPDKSDHHITAKIQFAKLSSPGDPLYRAIPLRVTNRKPYAAIPLSERERGALLTTAKTAQNQSVKAVFIEDSEKIRLLGEAVSVNEVVMFENRLLHKLLFEEIVWTEEEEKKRGCGLYVKTMELKPPVFIVKLLRFWPLMRMLNKLGVARAIAKDNAKMYTATPMMCAILCGDADEDFINAGRLLERIWLQATLLGLSVHLMTGILFLWQRIASGETKLFSQEHLGLIRKAYHTIASLVGAGSQNIALLFRIGKGDNPSARSVKLAPQILYQ